MRRFHYTNGIETVRQAVMPRVQHFGPKLSWFLERGYAPHPYQLAFHTLSHDAPTSADSETTGNPGTLLRFRCLVAGRRGGKTMSAAWEVVYYVLNPRAFHWDAHGKDDDEPLHVWVLVPNLTSSGRAAIREILKTLKSAGMTPGVDYKWNKGQNYIEFANGAFLEFKTAEQADNLVGAGIDILWIDEAAVIPTKDAYEYASPAMDDKSGIMIGTTTPRGKNWFYEEFWGLVAQTDTNIGTVEYRTCDNPYFPRDIFLYRKRTFHPLKFKQEYLAAFDAAAGKALLGDWLNYYEIEDIPLKEEHLGHYSRSGDRPRLRIENFELDYYIGIDPAIAVSDRADSFGVCVIGVPKDKAVVYVLDVFKKKIGFPDQLQLIQELHMKWRPHYFGIEAIAYQAALAQQAARLPGLPPVIPVMSKGKKAERIMSMAPLFNLGRVLIRPEARDFIDEWLDYDPENKHTKDDTLDAAEIAIGTAGIILPGLPDPVETKPATSMEELAARLRAGLQNANESDRTWDEHLGADW